MSKLTIKFEPDVEDGVGRLMAKVETEKFSGAGFFWAQVEDMEKFATDAGGYPLTEKYPACLRLGYNDLEQDDLVIFVEIMPADGVGNLSVRVQIANLYEPSESVSTRFKANYPELETFCDGLLSMANGVAVEAVLIGR